jgi:hypothetical protein
LRIFHLLGEYERIAPDVTRTTAVIFFKPGSPEVQVRSRTLV